ncbi:hypothetical protein BH11GEM1_BH11GEM1_10770 [soil metagenome]
MMKVNILAGIALLCLFPTGGCGCKLILLGQVTPGKDITLRPGDTTMVALLYGGNCGDELTRAETRFASSDSTIARVDSLTGHLAALRAGDARIWIGYPGETLTAT